MNDSRRDTERRTNGESHPGMWAHVISGQRLRESGSNMHRQLLAEAFKHRQLWGVYLGQYCLGALFLFFLIELIGRFVWWRSR